MRDRRTDRGLTLLEILLSLIVLVLGVIGILALFPPALQSSGEAIEDTNAALLAESVGHALTVAIETSVYDTQNTQWEVIFTHDLGAGSTKIQYTFILPKLGDGWKHYPSAVPPPPKDLGGPKLPSTSIEQSDLLFKLAADDWLRATTENVKNINDPTDSYGQYAFSFDVKKVSTLDYLLTKPHPSKPGNYTQQDLEGLTRLYEFRIHIFRVSNQGTSTGTGTTTISAGQEVRKLVATFTKRISL